MPQKWHQCLFNLLLQPHPPQQHQRNLLPLANGPRPRSHQQAFQKVGLKTSGITLVGNTSNQ
jgi:hypothetical protein